MLVAVAARSESEWARAMGAALTEALGTRKRKWLAEAIEVDPSTVSRILRGDQTPSFDQLSKMAAWLGVTRRELLARAGYIDAAGLIDPDAFPTGLREALLAIRDVKEKGVDSNGTDRPDRTG